MRVSEYRCYKYESDVINFNNRPGGDASVIITARRVFAVFGVVVVVVVVVVVIVIVVPVVFFCSFPRWRRGAE